MRADYLTRFKSKITQEDIDNLRRIKEEGRTVHDARYWLMQKYWDNKANKSTINVKTIEAWLKTFFIDL